MIDEKARRMVTIYNSAFEKHAHYTSGFNQTQAQMMAMKDVLAALSPEQEVNEEEVRKILEDGGLSGGTGLVARTLLAAGYHIVKGGSGA